MYTWQPVPDAPGSVFKEKEVVEPLPVKDCVDAEDVAASVAIDAEAAAARALLAAELAFVSAVFNELCNASALLVDTPLLLKNDESGMVRYPLNPVRWSNALN